MAINFSFNASISGAFSGGGFRYPADIDANLPTITFIAREPKGVPHGSVTLYMPPAVSINDGAGYSEVGLGFAAAALDSGNFSDAAKQADALAQKDSTYANLQGMEIVKQAAGGLGSSASDFYSYKEKKVLNPNTVLKYDGPAIRDFSFQFQMTPKSAAESDIVNGIHRFFRRYMHPEGDEFMLKYPDIWYIRFNAGRGTNQYLPKINDCYLTACSLAVNPSNNSFHAGGAPNELSLTVAFRETRQNKRKDI